MLHGDQRARVGERHGDRPPLHAGWLLILCGLLFGLLALFTLWKEANRPAELHIFDVPTFQMPATLWLDRFVDWMREQKLLGARPVGQVLPAGYSAIFNATTPLMGVLIGALFFSDEFDNGLPPVGGIYGDKAGNQFLELWRAHIGFFVNYTLGKATGDAAMAPLFDATHPIGLMAARFGNFIIALGAGTGFAHWTVPTGSSTPASVEPSGWSTPPRSC